MFPATVTGLMVASSEAISSSPSLPPSWKRKGEETVREGRWRLADEGGGTSGGDVQSLGQLATSGPSIKTTTDTSPHHSLH